MPIRIPQDLPALQVLNEENIFVMDDQRAINQDIRPMELGIVNLMPNKIETEVQILRLLSNTPLQINVDLIRIDNQAPKNTPAAHMDTFYHQFEQVKDKKYDGLIVTGAPLAMLEYQDVKYWDKMQQVMNWSRKHVQSTLFLCWAAHAAMYHFYGVQRQLRKEKLSGVFRHQVFNPKDELVRGFDAEFMAPHSRFGEITQQAYRQAGLNVLAGSETVGAYIAASEDKRMVFVLGHPEYDVDTLDQEYCRDILVDPSAKLPENYYPNDDPNSQPLLCWRSHGTLLYTNWLNYYVYQVTPYDLSTLN